MANVLSKGTGDRGNFLDVTLVPDTTYDGELDALDAAGSAIVGNLVTLTTAANYECTSGASSAIPDGKVIAFTKTAAASGSGWKLTVRLFHYTDQNSVSNAPHAIIQLPYHASSTMALGDTVIIYSTTYTYVTDGTSGGFGYVIGLDSTNKLADVLF